MKLWYAILNAYEDSEIDNDAIYLVRASNPDECTELVEADKSELPSYIQKFLGGIFEIGEDEFSEKPSVLAGPFISDSFFNNHEDNIYWRRDYPEKDWVNINLLHAGVGYFDCIYKGEN